MTYETWTKENGKWNSCETWFENETEAYNYLVRVTNQFKTVEAIRITTEEGKITMEEEL